MNEEKEISTIPELARMVAEGFAGTATKEDLKRFATKEDLLDLKIVLKADIRRVENKLDSVIDRTLPGYDQRITRIETTLNLPKIV
jgi:hypothetical protein